jgi:hypothetical protein
MWAVEVALQLSNCIGTLLDKLGKGLNLELTQVGSRLTSPLLPYSQISAQTDMQLSLTRKTCLLSTEALCATCRLCKEAPGRQAGLSL